MVSVRSVIAAVLSITVLAAPTPVASQSTGSISGRVTGRNMSAPPPNTRVEIRNTSGTLITEVTPDSQGNYTTGQLNSGSYKISAAAVTGYVRTYYPGAYSAAQAGTVRVDAGVNTPNIDISLPEGGSITGMTLNDSNGTPVGVVSVHAVFVAPAGSYTITGVSSGFFNTGAYNIELPSGRYRLYAVSTGATGVGLQPNYYNNQPTFDAADIIEVTNGSAQRIDFRMKSASQAPPTPVATTQPQPSITPAPGMIARAYLPLLRK
jgi:hypothetical protein